MFQYNPTFSESDRDYDLFDNTFGGVVVVIEMVFCYPNCSDLLWEKIVLVLEKKKLKFEAEAKEFLNFLKSLCSL